MKVSECLKNLKQNGPSDPMYGICSNLSRMDFAAGVIWHENKDACFTAWGEFSGSLVYPVPSFNARSPGHRFDAASEETMWSQDGEYGAARWRLLDHCIKWFEELGA